MARPQQRFQTNEAAVFQRPADISQLNGREIATWAGHTAQALVLADRLKTHQLRNIYSSVESLRVKYKQAKTENEVEGLLDDLYLLLPQLAYAAGRQRSVSATLFPFMESVIAAVEGAPPDRRTKAFANFFSLLESVVGFHKFFENNRNGVLHFLKENQA